MCQREPAEDDMVLRSGRNATDASDLERVLSAFSFAQASHVMSSEAGVDHLSIGGPGGDRRRRDECDIAAGL
jgi:hypothetical protein